MRTLFVLLAALAPAGLFAQASPTNLDFEAAGQLGATPPASVCVRTLSGVVS
jgi:hypothetical protein